MCAIALRPAQAHKRQRWIGHSAKDVDMARMKSALALTAACGALALAACNKAAEAPAAPPPATLHQVMVEQIDANADALWDITNAAIGADAGLDPALLDDAKWTRIAELAGAVATGAHTLATLDPVTVAAPGVKIGDDGEPGGHTAAQVQGFIDADVGSYRNMANTLADHAGSLAAAARARDVAVTGQLVGELDSVCEACHLNFWYPEQRDLMNQYLPGGAAEATAGTNSGT
jgi:hypothetical protein